MTLFQKLHDLHPEIQTRASEILRRNDSTDYTKLLIFASTLRDIRLCAENQPGEFAVADEFRPFYPGYTNEDFQTLYDLLTPTFDEMVSTQAIWIQEVVKKKLNNE